MNKTWRHPEAVLCNLFSSSFQHRRSDCLSFQSCIAPHLDGKFDDGSNSGSDCFFGTCFCEGHDARDDFFDHTACSAVDSRLGISGGVSCRQSVLSPDGLFSR